MAYQIKKKQNGFYICFELIAKPEIIAKLERTYKLDENVIRYLTIIMDKKTLKEKDDYLRKKTMLAEAAIEREKTPVENAEVPADTANSEVEAKPEA